VHQGSIGNVAVRQNAFTQTTNGVVLSVDSKSLMMGWEAYVDDAAAYNTAVADWDKKMKARQEGIDLR